MKSFNRKDYREYEFISMKVCQRNEGHISSRSSPGVGMCIHELEINHLRIRRSRAKGSWCNTANGLCLVSFLSFFCFETIF